jgi:hypothetical protein
MIALFVIWSNKTFHEKPKCHVKKAAGKCGRRGQVMTAAARC